MWFERRAGSEETLLALYDVVGAAEELDLEEQAHGEAFWAEVRVLYELPADEDAWSDYETAPDDNTGDSAHITMGQAVGLIEHLLGGRSMGGSGKSAT
jgi:hypothetical protein